MIKMHWRGTSACGQHARFAMEAGTDCESTRLGVEHQPESSMIALRRKEKHIMDSERTLSSQG